MRAKGPEPGPLRAPSSLLLRLYLVMCTVRVRHKAAPHITLNRGRGRDTET